MGSVTSSVLQSCGNYVFTEVPSLDLLQTGSEREAWGEGWCRPCSPFLVTARLHGTFQPGVPGGLIWTWLCAHLLRGPTAASERPSNNLQAQQRAESQVRRGCEKAASRMCHQGDRGATPWMAKPDGSFYSSFPPSSPNTCLLLGETFPGVLSLSQLRWASGWERTSSFTLPADETNLSSLTAPEAPSPPDGRPVLFGTLSLCRFPVTGVNPRRSSHGGWSPGHHRRKWLFSTWCEVLGCACRKEGRR